MIDADLLKEKIKDSGMTIKFIHKKLGLSYQGFMNKLNGDSKFNVEEMQVLTDLLRLSDEEQNQIFLHPNCG
jgi:hypothetical protein